MNRLHHLKETMPENVQSCKDYDDCEFVILDYNSTDGLEEWLKNSSLSLDPKIKYYKNKEATAYKRSHSRNMAMRLAKGEVLVNLDADNFLGNGFIDFIFETFVSKTDTFISPDEAGVSDVFGKMCFRKDHFEKIGGYDEQIEQYGFEDIDLRNRLKMSGLEVQVFSNTEFSKAIIHSEKERVENEAIYKNLANLYLQKISPSETQFCFIFKDQTFEMAIISDSLYEKKNETVQLLEPKKRYNLVENSLMRGNLSELNLSKFEILNNADYQTKTIHFYSQIKNKLKAEQKLIVNQAVANSGKNIGQGIVFLNFDYSKPIILD